MSGKGSHPRPFSVPYEEYADRWDNIFKKKKSSKKEETEPCKECHGVGTLDKDYSIFSCPFCNGTGKVLYTDSFFIEF